MTNMTVQRRNTSTGAAGMPYSSASDYVSFVNATSMGRTGSSIASGSDHASGTEGTTSSLSSVGQSNSLARAQATSFSEQARMVNEGHLPAYLIETPIFEPLQTRPSIPISTISYMSALSQMHSSGIALDNNQSSQNISPPIKPITTFSTTKTTSPTSYTKTTKNTTLSYKNEKTNPSYGQFYPLPMQWNDKDKCTLLSLSKSNLRVSYQGQGKSDSEAAAIKANCAIPVQCGVFYFEIEIISKGRDGYIGIGFCTASVSVNRLPGWEMNSWGYHGDDGNSFNSSGTGKAYGPSFSTGDVIGCCINFVSKEAFYTKNGVALGTAFKDLKGTFLPSVGMRTPGEIVEANFGAKPFKFDIGFYMRQEKARLMNALSIPSPTDSPSISSSQVASLIQLYFEHHGYADSLAEMQKSTLSELEKSDGKLTRKSAEESVKMPFAESPEIRQREPLSFDDVRKRKKIQFLIRTRAIDEAMNEIRASYPNLLDTNQDLMFLLECRQWIEMMRKSMENTPDDSLDAPFENESLDMEMAGNKSGEKDAMEIDSSTDALSSFLKMIHLGQSLSVRYAHDDNKMRLLSDLAILLAYKQVDQCGAMKEVFDFDHLEKEAAIVNAAILEYQGKEALSVIEKIILHSVAMREVMVEEGLASAAIVNPMRLL